MSSLFFFMMVVVFVAALLTLAEAVAVHCMFQPAFSVGHISWRKKYVPLAGPMDLKDGCLVDTSVTVIRFPNTPRRVAFRRKVKWLQVNTPFPFKGLMIVEGDRVLVLGRMPVGPTLFLVAWTGLVLLSAIQAVIGSGERRGTIIATLVAMLFFMVMTVMLSMRMERRRFEQTVVELEARLSLRPRSDAS